MFAVLIESVLIEVKGIGYKKKSFYIYVREKRSKQNIYIIRF